LRFAPETPPSFVALTRGAWGAALARVFVAAADWGLPVFRFRDLFAIAVLRHAFGVPIVPV